MAAVPPRLNQRLLEPLLRTRLPQAGDRRLVLVYGTYEPTSPAQFTLEINGNGKRKIRVTDQPSVLGLTAAWLDHLENAEPGTVLVVTTTVADANLGWDIRGHAVKQETLTVNPVEIVGLKFGATRVDSRVWEQQWLLDALLAAEPTDGWPRTSGVLTYDTALRALTAARLGVPGDGLDFDGLLAWTQSIGGPERYCALGVDEKAGIGDWLAETAGDPVRPLLKLVDTGRDRDVMALGVVATAITGSAASTDVATAIGGLFPGMAAAMIRGFATAVETVITRTLAASESGAGGERVQLVLETLERADHIAAEAGLSEALAGSSVLPSAFHRRLGALAAALPAARPAEAVLRQAQDHQLARFRRREIRTAEMAVRVARWLAQPVGGVESVAAGVRQHLADWGWVDRALDELWTGDDHADDQVSATYRRLVDAATRRRAELDEAFAARLAPWATHAAVHAPQGCLLVEDVLARVAVPVAAIRPPLVVVVDGMSAAAASDLGEELGTTWYEVSPEADRRVAAVAAIPSVTVISRASLLCGELTDGGQPVERAGFEAFWKRHRKQATLFHQADIGGGAGSRLDPKVINALAGDAVVGAVLNTIDDALDHGREKPGWRVADVRFLPELLTQARNYGRPVLLVADHGHVLDRGQGGSPVSVTGDRGARWRTGGSPAAGEVALSGPRVLAGGGSVVMPWREDIRYAYRKAGYHGGATLAEMTVPVLAFVPTPEDLPPGWSPLPPEVVRPRWWEASTASSLTKSAPQPVPPAQPRKRKAAVQDTALFEVAAPASRMASDESLGARVVASEVYKGQKAFVAKAPDAAAVVRIIDGLAESGERMSLSAVAEMAGKAARRAEGLFATLQRLLNVEGYPVLELIDSGRRVRLNVQLLREQFKVDDT